MYENRAGPAAPRANPRRPQLVVNSETLKSLSTQPTQVPAPDALESSSGAPWFAAYGQLLELTLREQDPAQGKRLVTDLLSRLRAAGLPVPQTTSTPYLNTIPATQQPAMPGDRELERRIKSFIRWNAMAMVVRANSHTNVGGHISTYASSATLY